MIGGMRVLGIGLAAALSSATASAETLPWIDAGDVPLPQSARSVETLRRDEPLRTRPDASAPRRGSAAISALLPLYGARRGPGCHGRWFLVGPTAWVCEDHVELSTATPLAAGAGGDVFANGLPLRYHFVGPDGSFGYHKLRLAEEGVPDAQLEPGFAIAILQEANKSYRDTFGLTTKGIWVPMRDVHPVREFRFRGDEITNGELAVGWVFVDEAPVYKKPRGIRRHGERRSKLERLIVLETRKLGKQHWYRIGESRWVSAKHVRVPELVEPPAEALAGERWIDVHIATQTLTAYEGKRPVFATVVSTGKGKGKSELATPKGVHRVWVKLRTSDMSNLEDEGANRYYAIQDVPWVMYFKKGYGLHGTFWHRQFGRVRSHGCVNLTPLDAQRLFHWTSPRIPAGWTAALPTDYDPGTIVRVR